MNVRAIFITGAASGIGKATAQLFARQNWRVGLADLDGQALDALASDIGAGAMALPVDVTDAAALRAAIDAFTAATGGRLDALFNSAGLLDMRLFEDAPIERLHAIIDVNVKGVINGIMAASPALKATPASTIITMSSAAAIFGVPQQAVYSASKFAVRALTEALHVELAPHDIWVCDIMVSFVDTPMLRDAAHKAASIDRVGVNVTPEQVAQCVLDAITNRHLHVFVGDAERRMATLFDAVPWDQRAARIGALVPLPDR
ncbi:MAG: SDR family oxidoreductase [Caulobacterales bacterium]